MNRAVRATLVGALVAWGTMIPSRAGGLELYEIGTQDGGLASAGYAARAQDPSTENGGNSVGALPAGSSSDNEALAKKLANPISSLISVPFQLNYDGGFGPDGEGDRWTLNIQPVIPITLNSEWNVISRTILPVSDHAERP